MKLSVSLSESDVAVLDEYVKAQGLSSRSAAVQHAVRLLQHPTLEQDYEDAWREWDTSGDAEAWEITVGDGLSRAAR